MQLSYRGVHYRYQPTSTEMIDSGVSGQYRGRPVNFTYPRHIPVPQATVRLKYRGAEYCAASNHDTGVNVSTRHPEMAPGEKAVVMPLPSIARACRLQTQEFTSTHLDNIRKRLEHRIEVARQRGDQLLLSQLEQERRMYA